MPGFVLNISTPEKLFYSGPAESLVLKTTEGEMGVLSGHALMVVALDTAPIRIKTEDSWREAAISGGFAQIKGNQVTILAETAEWPEEIEVNRAMEAKKRAEERLKSQLSEIEYIRSQVALKRALMRMNLVKGR